MLLIRFDLVLVAGLVLPSHFAFNPAIGIPPRNFRKKLKFISLLPHLPATSRSHLLEALLPALAFGVADDAVTLFQFLFATNPAWRGRCPQL
jgi:hypothetical protein